MSCPLVTFPVPGTNLTDYDVFSVMNQWYSGFGGLPCGSDTLTTTDIKGLISLYGYRCSADDVDCDGTPDYKDNCLYLANNQYDSNFDAERKISQESAYPEFYNGTKPTASDPPAKIAAWHQYFKGDACDPTVTVSAKPEQVAGPNVNCIAIDYVYGVGTRSRATTCPTWTETSFSYRGYIGNERGEALNYNNSFSSNFCKCNRNLDSAGNRELCYNPFGAERCELASVDLFREQWASEDPNAPWKHITTESPPATGYQLFFPSTGLTHAEPGITVPRPQKWWLFSQDEARILGGSGAMKGFLATHNTGFTGNFTFNYRSVSTEVHVVEQGIFVGPPQTIPHKWIPRPAFDFHVEYRLPRKFGQELRLFTSNGLSFMNDITPRLSSSAQSLYSSVADGGQILLDDSTPDDALHDAVVVDDQGRFLGAMQPDIGLGANPIGANLAQINDAPLPGLRALAYSAARKSLYALANNDLVIRDVTIMLDGGAGRTVVPLYHDIPVQLEGAPAQSTQMVWLEPANALMVLSRNAAGGWDLTSVGLDGYCRLLWSTTALPANELANARLDTSPLGELVLTSNTSLITFTSRGEPRASSVIDAPALANVVADDQSFHYAAYAAPPPDSLLNMAKRTVARDALHPGLCAAAWLQSAALASSVLNDAWRNCETPTAGGEPGIARCLNGTDP